MLDEPTNHLDIDSIQWLEDFLIDNGQAVVVISHDRAFVDHITTRTIEVTMGRIYDYKVNYSQYLQLRKERREQQQKAYDEQQKMIAETREFIERFKGTYSKTLQVQSRVKMLEKLEIRSEFREGLRVTDDAPMNVVEMVLVGSVNKDIVNQINRAGARAVGLSGKDGMLLHAEKKAMVVTRENQPPEIIDLGNVGRVTRVETTLIFSLMKDGFVPVIAPVGVDDEGHTYNINADAVAVAVAGALRARRLIMLTDVAGVLDPEGKLIQSIRVEDAAGLYENGTVTGGMIPKLNCCIDAIEQGVEKVMIVDGRVENCVLLELLTDQGVGTEIVGEER